MHALQYKCAKEGPDSIKSSSHDNGVVMLSEALQRNAKHEARLSNISDLFSLGETGVKLI